MDDREGGEGGRGITMLLLDRGGGDSGRWEVKCLLSRVVHNTMNRAY